MNTFGEDKPKNIYSFMKKLSSLVLGAQLLFLIVTSVHQFNSFNLTLDFSFFHQSWVEVGKLMTFLLV